eukprot:4069500-Pleurochrysis_carterae.AAC.1
MKISYRAHLADLGSLCPGGATMHRPRRSRASSAAVQRLRPTRWARRESGARRGQRPKLPCKHRSAHEHAHEQL